MKRMLKVWIWVGLMTVTLAGIVVFGEAGTALLGEAVAAREEELTVLAADALLDKAGITQRVAVYDWLTDSNVVGDERRVWVSKNGGTHFHSYPLCGGMKAPMVLTQGEAVDAGYIPCKACWAVVTAGTGD